jgi:septal ring factor EnvC (AmiA/AmiB activator)
MSSIGKIFVVLNLVLSLLVVGAAASLLRQTDVTKEQVAAVQKDLATARTALDDANAGFAAREHELNEGNRRLQEEKDDLDVARQNLERANQKLDLDNQTLRDDVSKINQRIESLEASHTSTQQRSQDLADQNEALRTEAMNAKDAQRQAELARRELSDQIAAANTRADDLQAQLESLTADSQTDKALLEVAIASGFDPLAVMAMPRIDATVADVDSSYGFVILDKGAQDDVKKGFTFEVYRGGTYLGRVKVDEVYPVHSSASIVLQAPGAAIQRHDQASTHLN